VNDKEFLEHFGIPGMRWGRRKGKKSTTPTSQEHKAKEMLKKKKLSSMTNAEIKTLNERLQLERQFKDLTRSERSAGKKFVMDFLESTAKQAVSTLATKHLGELMKKFVK
jgi:hypothetical protein